MSISPRPYQRLAIVAAAALIPASLAIQTTVQGAVAASPPSKTTTLTYDSFSKSGGYTLADYHAKWSNDAFGIGEMAGAGNDTRNFKGSRFNISANPFHTAFDYSVFDHIKYIATSTQNFPVPTSGSVEISSTIQASTPGTQPGRVIHGTYSLTGEPYAEPTLQGQQAGAVMNVIDFSTGQLFDWFVAGDTAFTLIERLPSNVTGNTSDPTSPAYVGRSQMYTQIISEVPAAAGVAHRVSIRFSRSGGTSSVDYFLDGNLVSHVDHVGIPLDVQGQPFTGTYPSLGPGEELGPQINSLTIGHGLFSLLDAFPFQHPESPELDVSVPTSERIFGQGAIASFDDFKVKTVTNK